MASQQMHTFTGHVDQMGNSTIATEFGLKIAKRVDRIVEPQAGDVAGKGYTFTNSSADTRLDAVDYPQF